MVGTWSSHGRHVVGTWSSHGRHVGTCKTHFKTSFLLSEVEIEVSTLTPSLVTQYVQVTVEQYSV